MKKVAASLYIINKHAKIATCLYNLKHMALSRALKENQAKKIGVQMLHLHRFYTLIKFQEYYFHIPSTKEDLRTLRRLPILEVYNPKAEHLSLSQAKRVINHYLSH
ncbi:YkyB-like protein [Bacillus sp. OV194]|nr:YkyB-like protein [Bacillus sp. OV194]